MCKLHTTLCMNICLRPVDILKFVDQKTALCNSTYYSRWEQNE